MDGRFLVTAIELNPVNEFRQGFAQVRLPSTRTSSKLAAGRQVLTL